MEARIEKLENHFSEMQKALFEVLANVKSINQTINKAMDLDEKVIRLDEKQKAILNKISELEKCKLQHEKSINGINLKIAGVSGAWTIIMFLISKI